MHDFVVARLLDIPRAYSSQKAYWSAVGKRTGIPGRTVEKIARRQIIDPGVRSIERLADDLGYTPRRAAAFLRRNVRPSPARATA